MNRILLIGSALASLAYFATHPWHPYPGSIALKGLSVSLLALLALREASGRPRLLLVIALALSSLGDVLLDWPADLFVPGLGAFLIAHLCFVGLFGQFRPKPVRWAPWQLLSVAALVCFSLGFTWYLLPAVGPIGPAVMAYIGAITAMVFSAVVARWRTPLVIAGAVLFLVSDTVLGWHKFRGPFPLRQFIVWPTYYLAQLCITLGMLRESTKR